MSSNQISESDIDTLLARLNSGESDPSRQLSLDAPRRNAILNYTDVQACPGSGKTTLVAQKLLLLLKNWHDPYSGICVLTHSNVAIAEIVSRVGSDVAGSKLLSYPHFIGTIQDFTNTFLALPYARSREWDVHLAEEGEFASFVDSSNLWNFKVHDRAANKKYLFSSYFKRNKINPALFSLEHKDGLLKVGTAFMDDVNQVVDLSKSNFDETHFLRIRLQLCKKGLFLYSEMYELARQAVASNSDLLAALRSRFVITILDEMQDTQRHQDDLLNLVFPSSECAIQRFGDPDQSIFDAMGSALPNTTYNDATLHCIRESRRFIQPIASALGALSYRRVGPFIGSQPQLSDGPRNTIFLFEDTSAQHVLPAFAKLALTLPTQHRSVIKAVGGIGRIASPTGLTLTSYWPAFDSKTQSLSVRARSLYDAVRCCARADEGDVARRYQVLQSAVLEWMRRAGRKCITRSGKTMSFNRAMLNSYLKESEKGLSFGELMNSLVNGKLPSEDVWTGIVEDLRSLLELDELNDKAKEFAAYSESIEEDAENEDGPRNPNIYDAVLGVRIALATIHSVKGETHDATLVCETKYRSWYDIHEMVEFLCNPEAARPVADYAQPNSKETNRAAFMKRLFVAMSRPRYLLCLAVMKSHLSEVQRNHLRDVGGWVITDLTVTNGSADP
jgi:hypothetical protein